MINTLLFASTALIWGSTWLAIKFQLGGTDPLVSIISRFTLAALLLLLYAGLRKKNLRYALKDHLYLALQGVLLFGVNYWLLYVAEIHLASGLVAVIFSTMLIWNILCAAAFLNTPLRLHMIAGALTGLAVVFVALGKPFRVELSFAYAGSLIYLAVFGSIFAFGAYLRLLGSIGVDKAAYLMLVTPIIALLLSTIFEGYRWPLTSFFGLFCIVFGNLLIMKKAPGRGRKSASEEIA